jgi:hypothetical protein
MIFHCDQHIGIKITVSTMWANPGRDILEDKPLSMPLAGKCDQFLFLGLVSITEFTWVNTAVHH